MYDSNFSKAVYIFIALVIVSLVADGIDIFAYRSFMNAHGIGFFEAPGWALTFRYFLSYPGNILTIISLSPWITALFYLTLLQRRNK